MFLQDKYTGGAVALVLYYMGVYLPNVDRKLIDLADYLGMVLICMPDGEPHLRYGELISGVMEYICRGRATSMSIISGILVRISSAQHHQQTVGTAMQMLCSELSGSVVLCAHERRNLEFDNLA